MDMSSEEGDRRETTDCGFRGYIRFMSDWNTQCTIHSTSSSSLNANELDLFLINLFTSAGRMIRLVFFKQLVP